MCDGYWELHVGTMIDDGVLLIWKVSDAMAVADASTAASLWIDELMVGRCYSHRCDHSGNLFVKPTYSSHWIFCPYNENVMVVDILHFFMIMFYDMLVISTR